MGFELIYLYKHCAGDKMVIAGTAATREEAIAWISGHDEGYAVTEAACDTVGSTCPASFCAMRGQRPVRFYRPEGGE
jgi:hypothetical protein